jgi:hypothetical protein
MRAFRRRIKDRKNLPILTISERRLVKKAIGSPLPFTRKEVIKKLEEEKDYYFNALINKRWDIGEANILMYNKDVLQELIRALKIRRDLKHVEEFGKPFFEGDR